MAELAKREKGIATAFKMLDCLKEAERPLSINEIAKLINAPRSTAYNLAKFLLDESILESYGNTGRVFLGPKLFLYGQCFEANFPLIEQAIPILNALSEATGERSELNGIAGNKQSVLYYCDGKRAFRWLHHDGVSYPLPLTASGRFLVGSMNEEKTREIFSEEELLRDGKLILNWESFWGDVKQARKDGYACVSGLIDEYVAAIATPLYDFRGEVFATVSVTFPSGELKAKKELLLENVRLAQEKLQTQVTA